MALDEAQIVSAELPGAGRPAPARQLPLGPASSIVDRKTWMHESRGEPLVELEMMT
jgi:hypothetical protein